MKILIVDDHPVVIMVIREEVLKAFSGAELDTAGSLNEAIQKAAGPQPPDLVILDLGLSDSRGPETVVKFRAAHPGIQPVVFTADDSSATILACLKAGAAGYILKTSEPEAVGEALRLVRQGRVYLPPRAEKISTLKEGEAPKIDLTDRQLDVLRLLAQGLCNKDIARLLQIAENTVKGHVRCAFAALDVSSRVQAVRAMERLGIEVE